MNTTEKTRQQRLKHLIRLAHEFKVSLDVATTMNSRALKYRMPFKDVYAELKKEGRV